MARFQHRKTRTFPYKLIFSLCFFAFLIVFFFQGLDSLSASSVKRQKESLSNALTRGITYCYAVEGAYPESLEYLKKYYGLVYDESRFFVDYQITGSNIMPDITIIERQG